MERNSGRHLIQQSTFPHWFPFFFLFLNENVHKSVVRPFNAFDEKFHWFDFRDTVSISGSKYYCAHAENANNPICVNKTVDELVVS